VVATEDAVVAVVAGVAGSGEAGLIKGDNGHLGAEVVALWAVLELSTEEKEKAGETMSLRWYSEAAAQSREGRTGWLPVRTRLLMLEPSPMRKELCAEGGGGGDFGGWTQGMATFGAVTSRGGS
jgi:hypothetical protein